MSTTSTIEKLISLYPTHNHPEGTDISVQEFLDMVATGGPEGRYIPTITKIRELYQQEQAETDAEKKKYLQEARRQLKDKQPAATMAGTFSKKTKEGLQEPSGLMAIDMDHLGADFDKVRSELAMDQYTFALFRSVSGDGLCVLVRVDPARWADSFDGLREYYGRTYDLMMAFDRSCRNINRLRYLSYDPEVFVREKPNVFRQYITAKQKKADAKPIGTFIHTQRDLDYVIRQIIDKRVDITPEYSQRLRVCFALISELGESAFDVFDAICRNHHDYDEDKTKRMFKSALGYGAREIRINTLYYYAKQAGLDVLTQETKQVVSMAAMRKKQKVSEQSAVDELVKMEGLRAEDVAPIVKQVYEAPPGSEFSTDETLFDQLELFLKKNYPMVRNEITRYIEDEEGRQLKDENFNSIWVHAVKTLGDKVRYEMVTKLIHSSFTPTYNPIKDFFAQHASRKPTGLIKALAETIETDTGMQGVEFWPDYTEFWVRKWLVGLISTVFERPCPLVLVLTGPGNTGKTEWFRRLLPRELHDGYFADSKWLDNTDNEIVMCKSLISFNDEFGKNGLKDAEHFKSLASKDYFTLREPYGKSHVRLRRLAMMAGTSNPKEVIVDPHNNRRIIPINVLSINHAAYNAIDKTDLLIEAYHAWRAGERHDLTREDIARLQAVTGGFYEVPTERDLIEKYFEKPPAGDRSRAELMSQGEILEYLTQASSIKTMKGRVVSSELKAMGYDYSDGGYCPIARKSKRGFWVIRRPWTSAPLGQQSLTPPSGQEELKF